MVSTKNFSLVSMICISLHLHEESFSIGMLGIEIGISLDVSKNGFQHKRLNFQMNWWKVRCNQVTRIFKNWKTSSVRLAELFFHSLRACLSMYRTTIISRPWRHDNQISDTCWAFSLHNKWKSMTTSFHFLSLDSKMLISYFSYKEMFLCPNST